MHAFSPFEEYMLSDDSPRYSMTCHMRFWFQGEIHRMVFEKVLILTLKRHPLLSSIVKYKGLLGFRKGYFYPVLPLMNEIVKWHKDETDFDLQPHTTPDLRARFFIKSDLSHSLLLIQFHHSVSDGMGIFQFMEDLLLLYDQEMTGNQHNLKPLNVKLLDLRKTGGLTPSDWHQQLKFDFQRFKIFWSSLPSPLPSQFKHTLTPHANLTAVLRMVLPNSVTLALQSRAHQSNVTLNDILILSLYKTIDHIHHQYPGQHNKFMRISIPISMRKNEEDLCPAANFVSMVFLDRHPSDLCNPDALLQNIASEMLHVKNNHRAYTLLQALRIICKIPILLPILLKLPFCMATAVLTNLGKPFQKSALLSSDGLVKAGNLTLEGLDGFPPLRNGTAAAISVNSYGGQLSITLRYDSRRYLEMEAQKILSYFVDSLRYYQ